MIGRWIQVLSLCLFFGPATAAWGQMDSSNAILLRPSRPTTPKLDGSRYKVRTPESKKEEDVDDEEKPGTYIPSPVPKSSAASKISTPVNDTVPATLPATSPATAPQAPTPAPTPVVDDKPSVTVQVKELILGGSDGDIDEAKRSIHPEDPRANIVQISLAPAYFYDGSSSNYSFRNYHTDGPGLGLGMKLWLTPFFGIQSRYFTSVGASVRDGVNMMALTEQEFEAGVRFRRQFGYSRKSATLSWGIDYRDAGTKISKEATSMVGAKSSGLSFTVEGMLPTSTTYARTFEFNIRPSQHHSEQDTGVSARSGTKVDSNAVSLSLGGQWTLDRRNQIFWRGEYSVERDLFTGTAAPTDPKSGVAPNGVSVTNSLAIFYFGFRWGS